MKKKTGKVILVILASITLLLAFVSVIHENILYKEKENANEKTNANEKNALIARGGGGGGRGGARGYEGNREGYVTPQRNEVAPAQRNNIAPEQRNDLSPAQRMENRDLRNLDQNLINQELNNGINQAPVGTVIVPVPADTTTPVYPNNQMQNPNQQNMVPQNQAPYQAPYLTPNVDPNVERVDPNQNKDPNRGTFIMRPSR